MREEELERHLAAQPKETGAEKKPVSQQAPEARGKVPAIFAEDSQGQRGYTVLKQMLDAR
jgi:hypothetical protein